MMRQRQQAQEWGVGSGDVGVLLLGHLLSQPTQDGGLGVWGSLLSSAHCQEGEPSLPASAMSLEIARRLCAPQPGVGVRGNPDQAWEPSEAT